jgi:hypothetical protein
MDKYDSLIARYKAINEELKKDNTPIPQGVVNGLGGAFGKEESKFKEVQHKIEGEGHSKESAAKITAAIGRKEIGQKAMTERSVAARKSDMDKRDANHGEDCDCHACIAKSKPVKHEGVRHVASTTWIRKNAEESLMCSDNGQWKLDKGIGGKILGAIKDGFAGAGAAAAGVAPPKPAPVVKPVKKDEADESPYTKRNRQIQGYKNQTNDALANQRAQRKPFDYSNHVTPATPNSKIGQPSRPWVPNAPKIKI